MDFMRLLKSLEELLYELVSWLVFYPITLWRSVVRPLEMMRYADSELGDAPEDQYEDTLSPPLFLLITLMLAQAAAAVFPVSAEVAKLSEDMNSSNLLIARGVIFGVFPLVMAVVLLRGRGIRITRNTLRPPFYSQCYVAAPFVLVASLALDALIVLGAQWAALASTILVGVTFWYALAQWRWFRLDLAVGRWRAAYLVARALLIAISATSLVGLAVGWELINWK